VVASQHGHRPDQSKPVTPGSATPYTTLVTLTPMLSYTPVNHQGLELLQCIFTTW
jgi:hypothetical protein